MSDYPADSPFAEAAEFYRFRPPYAPQAFACIRDAFHLDAHARVLDLGCGPGTVAIPLSGMVGQVVAVDPSEAMLSQGRKDGIEACRSNIDWICARAEDVTDALGMFNVVTMGQSFHWMDRDVVLRQLTPMVVAGGGIALINPGKRRPQESWEGIVNEVVIRHIGRVARHPKKSPELQHEPALLRSAAFSRFTAREFAMEFQRDVSAIIGYVYSLSDAPRSGFGDRIDSFERDLTAALLDANPSGVFRERLETEVLIARKD